MLCNVLFEKRTMREAKGRLVGVAERKDRSLILSKPLQNVEPSATYSLTDISSFKEVDNWIETVRAKGGDKVVIMLVGNKIDLNDQR